jgi:hypothetical protein
MEEEVLKGEVVNRVLPPAGLHKAWIIGVVMIGTVDRTFEGHTKRQKKVRIYFELADQKHTWKPEEGPKNFIHEQEFTVSMGANATLRKLLTGLKGGDFTDQQAKDFNIFKLLGCCLQINLIAVTSKTGNKRMEVQALIKLADTEPIADMVNKSFLFSFTPPFKTEVFNKLAKFVQDDIKSSDEYKELYGASAQGTITQPTNTTTTGNASPVNKRLDVPF